MVSPPVLKLRRSFFLGSNDKNGWRINRSSSVRNKQRCTEKSGGDCFISLRTLKCLKTRTIASETGVQYISLNPFMTLYDREERDRATTIAVVLLEGLRVLCSEDEDSGCVLWSLAGLLLTDNIW